jgi:hypothetical protein
VTTVQLANGILRIPEAVLATAPPKHKVKVPHAAPPTHGSYLAISHFEALDTIRPNSSFTISMWFKASEAATRDQYYSTMLALGNFRKGSGIGIGLLKGGGVYCAIGSAKESPRLSDVAMVVSQQPFSDGRYHHVSCVYNYYKETLALLIDGNFVELAQPFPYVGGEIISLGVLDIRSVAPISPSHDQAAVVIGHTLDVDDDNFEGEIVELRFWNTVRTQAQEARDMWSPMFTASEGLVLCVPLNDCASNLPFTGGFSYINETHTPLHLLHGDGAKGLVCPLHYHPLIATS